MEERKDIEVELMVNIEGEDEVYYVDLFDIYKDAEYTIPYSRWVKSAVARHQVKCERKLSKDTPVGRPRIHYYAILDDAENLIDDVARRKRINFSFVC